ncbi:hypothetical protein BJ508DRAFT_415939 [Ascobolus immersus RN42]|uniref:Calcium-dependent phosphotriesterase n=1 Tax=Ascobolus immersus RN42 TaxID=1160509 RepID=A0A3N4I029_ASCIM|nr:hypothetical protein BJ508DRAFT_415939 [Ascobolus immersus RN42]
MGYIVPLVFVALFAVAFQLLDISRTITLIAFTTDFDKIAVVAPLAQLKDTCELKYPDLLLGCEKIQIVNDVLYATCLSDLEARAKWSGPVGLLDDSILRVNGGKGLNSRIMAWDLKSDEVKELLVTNFPKDTERAFQVGFDIAQIDEGKLIFYIINMLPTTPVIQKFIHVPGQRSIKYLSTLPIPAPETLDKVGFPYVPNPNDVYIIPGTDATQIFVTNDHASVPDHTALSRKLEEYGRLKRSWISSYSEKDGTWKSAGPDAQRLRMVNGITGPRYNKDRNYVYVSELGDGQVLIYKRVQDATGRWGLELKQKVPVDFLGDNPTLSYPDEEDLYIIGHPTPANVKDHMALALEPEKQPTSGGRAARFATSQVEGGFFGTKGETAAPTVENLFVDAAGVMFNVSSTAVFYKHPVEEAEKELREDAEEAEEVDDEVELDVGVGNLRKGDLFVTGLLQKGIYRCKNFPA